MKQTLFSLLAFCLAGLFSFAQEEAESTPDSPGVEVRFDGFSKAYGNLLNIEETLKAIESQHPSLGDQVKEIRKEFQKSAVGRGFAGMVADMKRMMAKEFVDFEKNSRKLIREGAAGEKVSLETAKVGLQNIAKIKDGNLDRETLQTVISMNPEYRKNPLKEFQDGWVGGYSSKMDEKKREVNFLLFYPGSWKEVASSARSHLFTIKNDAGFGGARIALQVIRAPDPKYAKMDPVEFAKMLVPPGVKMIESGKATVAGLSGGRTVYEFAPKGSEVIFRQIAYSVYTKENFVTVVMTLDPGGDLKHPDETKRLEPLLKEMAAKLEIE